MTTTWPAAPAATGWRGLDGLVDRIDPLLGAEARAGGVHQVRWDPSRMTRVAFDGTDGQVVVLEATGAGTTRRALVDDPSLPGLRELLDPQQAAARFQEMLRRRVDGCEISVVSYRPGSRCVVRCALRGPVGRPVFYVKMLAGGTAVCLESHLALAQSLGPLVTPLVGEWPDLDALVTGAVPGRSASAVLADERSDPRTRSTLAHALGELLARVHRTTPGPLVSERLHTPGQEVEELESYLPAAWQADAPTALSLGWLVQALASTPPPESRPVFCHGSYRAGQVVVHRGALGLLDLDSSGVAAPEHDLGNAMAYLDWQRLCHPEVGSGSLSSLVLRGYRDGGGQVDRDALDWWHAAALAKIAGRRYRSLDTHHWDAVPALVNAGTGVLDHTTVPTGERGGYLRLGSGPEITDAARMTHLLQELLQEVPRADPATPVDITGTQTLRVAPGRRVVERYRLDGADDADLELIVKAYAEPERATIAHDNLTLFHALTDTSARVGSQAPLGVVADRGIVVCRAAPGRPLSELPGAVAASVAARCARWLRRVHATPTGLTRALDLRHEVVNLAAWAAEIGRADQRWAGPAAELAEALASAATHLPAVTSSVIHKDLHLGHVIVDSDGWARVIDLDEARMGDPALDVAHLCAYADETGSAAAGQAFLDAYGDLTGPDAPLRLAYFHAYTLLKITKQQARTQLTDESVHRGLRRLARGVSWLAE